MAALFVLALALPGRAEPPDGPSVGIACDPATRTLTLHYRGPGESVPDATADGAWIRASRLATVVDPDGSRPRWKAKAAVVRRCAIGGQRYTVRVYAHIFNPDILGRCGAAISAAASIMRREQVLLPRTPFEADCSREDAIVMTVLHADTGRIETRRTDAHETRR